jgi:transposase
MPAYREPDDAPSLPATAALPRELPPWPTAHRWFPRLSHAGAFERLAHALAMVDRERSGRE